MLHATPELRSTEFTVWESAVRPRLEFWFASLYGLSWPEARRLVAETMQHADEFWDVISTHDAPQAWAYITTMKRAEELFGSSIDRPLIQRVESWRPVRREE